jgi:predicted flap endonuclease-1-like 5' DNA nuclease
VNGLTLLALIAIAVGVLIAYRTGVMHGRREPRAGAQPQPNATPAPRLVNHAPASDAPAGSAAPQKTADGDPVAFERARLLRSYESEAAALRRAIGTGEAEAVRLRELADERRALFAAVADSRSEAARYRQIVVDIENNAPPPLLDVPGSPDDLKLIVGVGPVLERMLHQLGIVSYRQIAHWSERDIDEIDARLAEFPGRIRRDAWVTQARELHLSKYGERP